MPWMPGVPYDPGTQGQGFLMPLGVVAHRTYGSWNGDYAVGKGANPPVGFHFLVGKDPGQWVQFYDTTTRCAHAGTNANGNDVSVGIEVEGTNEDPMTPWQVDRVRDIVNWLEQTHGIAKAYRFSTAHDLVADHGYVPHSGVKGAEHTDWWSLDDWNRIVGTEPTPTPRRRTMLIYVRRPNGVVSGVSAARVTSFGIDNMADLAELQKATADPKHTADVSQKTWDALMASFD